MNKKVMLINVVEDESRIAIVEENILQEMLIEHRNKEQLKGNIYRGKVVQIQTSLQAAFMDFGEKKHGFLPNSDVNPALIGGKGKRMRDSIQSKLDIGQSILFQVTREPVDNKGAALTTNISLAGRFMVLNPDSDKGGISKKIEDVEERERLKAFLSGIQSEEHSVIIRTAGFGRSLSELKKDYTNLKKQWEKLSEKAHQGTGPELIREEDDFVTRTIRDYYTEDIKEIWIDNPETFQKVLLFFKEILPQRQKDLRLYVDDRSLFSAYKIEKQVEQLTSREVRLKSGGSIVIDQTEALVAIDVNSGRSNQEKNNRATAFRTNLEAAEEVARQLRLRNLGGLIVIDFIDMDDEKSKREVEDKIRDVMRRDKGHHAMNSISEFGLLEMSRQRLAAGISSTVENMCPVCRGKGKVPSILATTNLIIRSIRELAAKGNIKRIEGELPLELANYLLNDRRQAISDLEMEFDIVVSLRGNTKITTFSEKFIRPIFLNRETDVDDIKEEQDNANQPVKRNRGGRREKQKIEEPIKKEESSKKEVSPKQEQSLRNTQRKNQSQTEEYSSKQETSKQETSKQERKVATPKTSVERNEDTDEINIHPGCLYKKVFALSKEELEIVTTSFGNRMKGKIANQIPTKIKTEFLWDLTGSGINQGTLERPHLKHATPVSVNLDSEIEEEKHQNESFEVSSEKATKKQVEKSVSAPNATAKKTKTSSEKKESKKVTAKTRLGKTNKSTTAEKMKKGDKPSNEKAESKKTKASSGKKESKKAPTKVKATSAKIAVKSVKKPIKKQSSDSGTSAVTKAASKKKSPGKNPKNKKDPNDSALEKTAAESV